MKSRGIWLTAIVAAALTAIVVIPSCRWTPPTVDRSKEEWAAVNRLRAFLAAQETFRAAGLSAESDPQKEEWYATSLDQLTAAAESVELPVLDFAAATSPEAAMGGYYFVLGPCGKDGYSLYAVPAKYGGRCIKTFYVNQERDILEKDLKGVAPATDVKPSVDDGWDRSVVVIK